MLLSFHIKKQQQRNNIKNDVNIHIRLFSLIFALLELTNGFNIAPEAHYVATFKDSKVHRRSYFGYSVGLVKTNTNSWLLAGAPRANSTLPQVIEPGSLFKCDVSNQEKQCEEVVLDGSMHGYKDVNLEVSPRRNHAWTGVDLDTDRDGNVIIGAQRWSSVPQSSWTEYGTNGMCYFLGRNLLSGTAEKIPVLLRKDSQLLKYGSSFIFFYRHGEVGMSTHFTDTEDQQLLLGAPGVLNWQGSVAQLVQDASKKYNSKSAVVLNPLYTTKIQDSYYFGYSVTSGKFDLEHDYHIVAGAPRGASSYGMAIVFLLQQLPDRQRFLVREEKRGNTLGEYFGSSVAAPDLNGDGLSDLVVGAPLHSLQGIGDAGCVYVYINNVTEERKLSVNAIKLLGNPVRGARFGSALGTPGDLNKDGFQDLLVGAPYEYDGAVYVFMGVRNGIRETFSQKLTPESVSVSVPLKGFGISFSRPADIDNNKYPDFAIGSYLSDAAIVVKTRPVITVSGRISVTPTKLSIADTSFTATPCLSFSGYGAPEFADMMVTVIISQESGDGSFPATFSKNGDSDIQIPMKVFAGNDSKCEDLSVDLNVERSRAQMPISIYLKYGIALEAQAGPVIDPHATFPAPVTISFVTGCENDPECHADLVIRAHLKDFSSGDYLLIGNTSKIVLEVEVLNLKDPAFLPNVTISFPSAFERFPSGLSCNIHQRQNRRTVLICQLRNPLLNNAGEKFSMEFDVTALDDSSPDIKIDLLANSAADKEVNPADNKLSLQIKVKKKAKLEFRGSSNPEQFSYHHFDEDTIKANESVKIQSIFVISKLDVTPLGLVNVTVNLPAEFDLNGERMVLLQNFENVLHGKSYFCEEKDSQQDFSEKSDPVSESHSDSRRYSASGWKLSELSCSSQLFNCKSIVCRIGPWSKSFDVATLTVSYELNLTTLSHLIDVKKGAKISTEVFAEISSLKGHEEQFEGIWKIEDKISMNLIAGTLPPEPLAWWIYFMAILGGFLLLAIIAIVLFKIGFFKRKKKMQMDAKKATLLQEGKQRPEDSAVDN